jgi:hypothetical protein
MTQPTLIRSFLKAALVAVPVLLSAAPSEAAGATVKTTINGFTGVFAPGNWNQNPSSPSSGNSSEFTDSNTKLTLVKSASNITRVSGNIDITDSLFAALEPYQGVGKILAWTASGNYTWNTTNNAKFTFGVDSNNSSDTPLNTVSPKSGTFLVGDSFISPLPDFDPANPDTLDFSITRVGASAAVTGTGVISDFQFIAEYDVPGPLPVVGAAAAFAWSRRLRKRLNSAKTFA